jgi:hypothetical protein
MTPVCRTFDECLDRAREEVVRVMLTDPNCDRAAASIRISSRLVPEGDEVLAIVAGDTELRHRKVRAEGARVVGERGGLNMVEMARLVVAEALHDRVTEMIAAWNRVPPRIRPEFKVLHGLRA